MPIEVNGSQISEEEIEGMVASIKQRYAKAPEQPSSEELREMAVDSLIDHALVRQAAEKEDPEITLDDVHHFYLTGKRQDFSNLPFEMAKAEVESRIRVGKVVNRVTGKIAAVTTEEAKRFYEGNPKVFERPTRVHASHIVKEVKEGDEDAARSAIDEVKKQLDDGMDFAELAASASDCQENGGDLGIFPEGQMVEEFERVVFGMEEGQVSEPFVSPFGFHIAKLHKKLPADTVPFDEVRERLENELTNRRRHAAMQGFVSELRKDATISVTSPEADGDADK